MAKIAKMTLKIYWMIQKILSCENFLKMVQNGSIRKVITIKTIFEDIFIFSPAVGHPGLTLRKFSDDIKNSDHDPFIEIGVSDWPGIA